MHLRGIADDYECDLVDLWSMRVLKDRRAWSAGLGSTRPRGCAAGSAARPAATTCRPSAPTCSRS